MVESAQRQALFINCPKGLEGLLAEEVSALGADHVRETVAGVYAEGGDELPYRLCLWSRLANRVLLPLERFDVPTAEALYDGVKAIDWGALLHPGATLAVDFLGSNDAIRHTRFGAQKVKDAVVDRLVAEGRERPDVNLRDPDVRLNVHLARGRVVVSLDLSGESLHRRGYRRAMVPAPLKENLAAALLLRAGWPALCEQGAPLIDPMCGSGTLLVEAAMMAADMAPGQWRRKWGFEGWRGFDPGLWRQLQEEAQTRAQTARERGLPEIRGYDKDSRAVAAAQENIAWAGLEGVVRVMAKPLTALKKPTHTRLADGLLITNPPYGERWGEVDALRSLYQELGDIARREFVGWKLAVFTGNPELGSELRLRADKKYRFFNGTIPAELLLFALHGSGEQQQQERRERPLSDAAQMLANRLQKNQRKLQAWIKRESISCYRLYDSDIPEYAVAIDMYGDAIHVQEYAPPATVDERQARQRLQDVRQVLLRLFPACEGKLFFKERRRQKGDSQYQRQTPWHKPGQTFVVVEGQARIRVNLSDYLDTGLFLDHRPVRRMIAEQARGKRFLNLFCYTAAATVHAARGGAVSSVSVDLSNTYLDWAADNLALNGLDPARHQLVRADCLVWLEACRDRFDLIFLDPPTFSNSKKMEDVLDIQRDHGRIIRQAMAILAPGGTLIFSNNFRRFAMDDSIRDQFDVSDITASTIPPDFQRNSRIHNCWLIRHRVADL